MEHLESLQKWAFSLPFPLYITGGWVRNKIMNNKGSDIDLAGEMSSSILKKYLPEGAVLNIVNPPLDTSVIIIDGENFEYTPFRTEGYEAGEHTPKNSLPTNDPYIDSIRRDFTCNALYYEISSQKILDFHGGISDIQNKILRAVKDPINVFKADGLRIMRLIRFAAELGFKIDAPTWEAAKLYRDNLKYISAERIKTELDKILIADTKYNIKDAHYRGVQLIGELGIWKYIIPEMEDAIGVIHNPKFHKYDVYEHILQTVKFSPPNIRLAALMHDIGKPQSLAEDGNMYRHNEVGVKIIQKRLGQSGLKYPNAEIEYIKRLTAAHMYDIKEQTKQTKMRLFVAKNYDIIDDLIELIKADGMASGYEYVDRSHRFTDTLREIEKLKLPKTVKELALSGKDIIDTFPDLPKNLIGKVLDELLKDCLTGSTANQYKALINRAGNIINNLKKSM